eukprot:11886150-Karenia_brevis.AAC.1
MTAHSSARGIVCRPGTEPYAAATGSMVRTSTMHHPQPDRLSRQSLLYLPPLPSVPTTRLALKLKASVTQGARH